MAGVGMAYHHAAEVVRLPVPALATKTKGEERMSMLEKIHRGRKQSPPRILIYGTEGIGKSTMAASAPRPIFVPTEDGLDQIDCASFPLAKKLSDVDAALKTLLNEKHDFGTVVIDSVDWLEHLIWSALCEQYGVASIERVDGGYGRGYVHALAQWRKLLDDLDTLRAQRNMAVVFIGHSKVERYEDPEHPAYDRYSPRLHRLASAMLVAWCDAVLFATYKIATKTEDSGFGRERTIVANTNRNGGERILRTVGGPACVAKNRFGLPAEIQLSWPSLVQAMRESIVPTKQSAKQQPAPSVTD